jgi:DNA-binding transcriptional MerR regulator
VEEEQGIYRGEVTTIMGILADINVNVEEIRAYLKETMTMSGKRKKRMIDHRTPEERAAQAERHQELLRLIERAKIELATGKRPPPDPSPSRG